MQELFSIFASCPSAGQLVVAERGDVPLDAVLDTGLFDEDGAATAAGRVTAHDDGPTPGTEEYGIGDTDPLPAWDMSCELEW